MEDLTTASSTVDEAPSRRQAGSASDFARLETLRYHIALSEHKTRKSRAWLEEEEAVFKCAQEQLVLLKQHAEVALRDLMVQQAEAEDSKPEDMMDSAEGHWVATRRRTRLTAR